MTGDIFFDGNLVIRKAPSKQLKLKIAKQRITTKYFISTFSIKLLRFHKDSNELELTT